MDPADRLLALAREWDGLLDQIRTKPGFENFMRPPSIDELLEAAVDGPVIVVNVSRWRCDAMVVTSDGVQAVPLRGLNLAEADGRLRVHLASLATFDEAVAEFDQHSTGLSDGRLDAPYLVRRQELGQARRDAKTRLDAQLSELVGWLWDVVVEPLEAHLPTPSPGPKDQRPRVWWCPTGPLAFLPLHAAGRGQHWLHDRVVSSVTPTVRSLLAARARNEGLKHGSGTQPDSDADVAQRLRFLVASTFLSSKKLLDGPLRGLAETDVVTCSELAELRQLLPACDFVHFDCHGDQSLTDPAQGGVQMSDGVLRVFDVSTMRVAGEFAGLAACKTAVGGTELLDEAITLSAALHDAGFRHVIGTLWNLSESVAQDAFVDLYNRLVGDDGRFDPSEAARALADAVDRLRAQGADLHSWASLIHIGP